MPRKNITEFRVNAVVRTADDIDRSRMMLAGYAHAKLRKPDCVGHVEKNRKGEVFVRHVGDEDTAVYKPEELKAADEEAFWRYHHPVDGVHGYSEFRTYIQAVEHSRTRGENNPSITGPIYESKEELDSDVALPVRTLFELLGDDDD